MSITKVDINKGESCVFKYEYDGGGKYHTMLETGVQM